ncbi:hypothetical protein [Mucilaginibacter angelicae]
MDVINIRRFVFYRSGTERLFCCWKYYSIQPDIPVACSFFRMIDAVSGDDAQRVNHQNMGLVENR